MCAIFGFVARRPDARPGIKTLQAIVRGNIGRGPHAFGLAWIDARGRLKMYKQTGRMTDALAVLAAARDASMLVGHLRYATHGDASENINNHPHPSDGGWIVHNGVVRNYRELVDDLGVLPVSDCDSEILGHLIALADGPLARLAAWAVGETAGKLAMLGLWARPATMIVARRGNPLHFAGAAEGLYLATLPAGLPGRPRELRDNHVLRIVRRGGAIVSKSVRTPAPPEPVEAAGEPSLPWWAHCDNEYRGG